MLRSWRVALLALALVGASGAYAPNIAQACGGFFCSQQAPVNQSAERIIFSQNGDGTVTAVVQILYEGPSEQFAWVLPVPGIPDVGVSSDVVFDRLQAATNPQYTLNTRVEGTCREEFSQNNAFADSSGNTNNGSFNNGRGGGVSVLASGSVGPYDYDVIEVDESLDDRASVAVAWLEENNYDVLALGPETMRDYLDAGMNLLAFRLSKGNDSGDIRPIQMTYETETPMIPIKLTAVAANDDMGVLVWVLSDSRAIPVNYRSLVLNEALINWFDPAPTYNDVVVRAANESGGQGFVTELAGRTSDLSGVIFSDEWLKGELEEYATGETAAIQQAELVARVLISTVDWDGQREALREIAALADPEQPIDGDVLATCVDLIEEEAGFGGVWEGVISPSGTQVTCAEGQTVDLSGASVAVIARAFLDNVIDPVVASEALLGSRPYVTRLYSTLSAAEMTLDPVFRFNADLPDMSNVHTADRIIECAPSVYRWEAPWRVELPQGGVVRGRDGWPLDPTSGMPANLLIRQDSTQGSGEVVEDNTVTITAALEENNAKFPSPPTSSDDGCGCVTQSGRPVPGWPLVWLGLVGVGGLVWRRRRS